MIKANGQIPLVRNRDYVYKIDSFCLGRMLYFLTTVYDMNRSDNPSCFVKDRKSKEIVKRINDLTNTTPKLLTQKEDNN